MQKKLALKDFLSLKLSETFVAFVLGICVLPVPFSPDLDLRCLKAQFPRFENGALQ